MRPSILASLLLTLWGAASAKDSTDSLQSFLEQLHRRLSDQLELQKQQGESRHDWCHEKLKLLADEGKHAEGIIEGLRGTIRKLKDTKDDNIMLVQITEAMSSSAKTESQELALQLSTKAQLAEAQERLKLRGVTSSATHRFAAALRQACEASEKRAAEQQKALQEQISLLQSSTEAISAAEALHRIDESKVVARPGQVSLLQMASERAEELPDLLSLFRRSEPTEDKMDDLSLPFQSRSTEAQMQDVLPAQPQERPRVVELLAKMHSDETLERSKKESWCNEERKREQGSLESARTSAMLFSADARAHEHIKAQLQDELAHIQTTSEECDRAMRTILQEASNTSQALDATRQDDTVAAKVLSKALAGLTSLRDQWWGPGCDRVTDFVDVIDSAQHRTVPLQSKASPRTAEEAMHSSIVSQIFAAHACESSSVRWCEARLARQGRRASSPDALSSLLDFNNWLCGLVLFCDQGAFSWPLDVNASSPGSNVKTKCPERSRTKLSGAPPQTQSKIQHKIQSKIQPKAQPQVQPEAQRNPPSKPQPKAHPQSQPQAQVREPTRPQMVSSVSKTSVNTLKPSKPTKSPSLKLVTSVINSTPKPLRGGQRQSQDMPSPEELAAGGIGFLDLIPPGKMDLQPSQATRRTQDRGNSYQSRGPFASTPKKAAASAQSTGEASRTPQSSRRNSSSSLEEAASGLRSASPREALRVRAYPHEAASEKMLGTVTVSSNVSISTEDTLRSERGFGTVSDSPANSSANETLCSPAAQQGLRSPSSSRSPAQSKRLPSPTRQREAAKLETPREASMRRRREAADRELQALKVKQAEVAGASREIGLELRRSHARSFQSPFAIAEPQDPDVARSKLAQCWVTNSRLNQFGHATSNPVDAAMTSLSGVKQSFELQAQACEGLQKESADTAKIVAGRAHDLQAALDAEGRKLELTRDFYAKRQRRSASMKDVYDSQVSSTESYLQNLDQSCGKSALEQQSHEMQADVRALNDADMVFTGQPIKAAHLLRGSSKSLSPVEEAALAMGVSID
ncbi:unnamed protein product [Symbiodinium natans]|uniref:Uncharacterized protein n=1 Tax=Symbiodinium natans TaxID=878477 RepID=A0A812KEW6_9DINO|nr:unnamed protein product [Symbiodinium natans]